MTILAPGAGSTVTALSLVTRAMRLAGSIGKGETADDDEAQNGLVALNAMLDSWQIERLFVYEDIQEVFSWASGAQTRTVGPGGDFDTDQPARLSTATSFTTSGIEYPVEIIGVDAWAGISDKSTTSNLPKYLYPEYGASLVTLYTWPIPNVAITFTMRSWKRLQAFATITDALNLPLGASRALAFSLAEEWAAPEFGLTVQPTVTKIAASARRALRRLNAAQTPVLRTEVGLMTRRRGAYIYSGDPG